MSRKSTMTSTRRTVLAWLLAAVIAPPRLEPALMPVDPMLWYAVYVPVVLEEFCRTWDGVWRDLALGAQAELIRGLHEVLN
jgi:hypothetical protein